MTKNTVKQLREFLDMLPDDMVVLIPDEDHSFRKAGWYLQDVTKEGKIYCEAFENGDISAVILN